MIAMGVRPNDKKRDSMGANASLVCGLFSDDLKLPTDQSIGFHRDFIGELVAICNQRICFGHTSKRMRGGYNDNVRRKVIYDSKLDISH